LYTAGWDAHAEDVAHAMEVLGARRAQLVGHSRGAYVAMAAAGRWPHRVAAVALLDALGVPEAAAAAAVRPALATLGVVYPSEAEYLRAVRATGLFEPWSAPWEAHFRADLVPTAGGVGRRTSAGAVEADRAFLEAHDPRALWPRVRCPGLVVRCTAPLAGPLGEGLFIPESEARAFCAVAPSAEVLAVPSHHYSVLDDPAAELGVGRFLS
jgi:pimeloyl-ACP methyl ester carboxylesterase